MAVGHCGHCCLMVGGWWYFLEANAMGAIWPMFGVSNQLLAVMAALAIASDLYQFMRKRIALCVGYRGSDGVCDHHDRLCRRDSTGQVFWRHGQWHRRRCRQNQRGSVGGVHPGHHVVYDDCSDRVIPSPPPQAGCSADVEARLSVGPPLPGPGVTRH